MSRGAVRRWDTDITLDAGALIALERRDERMTEFTTRAARGIGRVIVPAPVVAQVWRGGPRSAPVARLLALRQTVIVPLDDPVARLVGVLLGLRHRRDVIDASVVICARRFRTPVVTSDPDDLLHLDPALRVVAL